MTEHEFTGFADDVYGRWPSWRQNEQRDGKLWALFKDFTLSTAMAAVHKWDLARPDARYPVLVELVQWAFKEIASSPGRRADWHDKYRQELEDLYAAWGWKCPNRGELDSYIFGRKATPLQRHVAKECGRLADKLAEKFRPEFGKSREEQVRELLNTQPVEETAEPPF